jgi:hypothetical protein
LKRSGVLFLCSVWLASILGCGGGKSSAPPPPQNVSISIAPTSANILVGAAVSFSSTVSGTSNPAVTYAVMEGANGGQINGSGAYVAPSAAGVYHVRVSSAADPSKVADATITVRDYARTVDKYPFLPNGYDFHTSSLLNDGSVLVAGGKGLSGITNRQSLRYNPAQDRFETDALLAVARQAHAAAILANGRVLVMGGFDLNVPGTDFDPVFTSTEIYDPATRAFSAGPNMIFPRRHHVVTTLADGRLLITGGIQLRGSGFGASPNTELYNSITSQITAGQRMIEGRWMHTATLLTDGRVLIVGGRSNNCTVNCPFFALNTAEIFDPATGLFTATSPLNIARFGHTATRLRDGRVLIVGGQTTDALATDGVPVPTVEMFDPVTGRFTVGGNLVLARSSHTATMLNNGKILIAGGFRVGSIIATERTEIFDPATGISVEGPPMDEFHARHTATLLPTGEVLIISGTNGGQSITVAERFR